jgi:TolB-like protein
MMEDRERMMENSERVLAQRTAARRTLRILLITVSSLFVASVVFMVVRGDRSAPEGRRVLAILPFRGPSTETGVGRYAGFSEGLAAYFGRADPNDLGVFGPASTAVHVESGEDPLAVGRILEADMVLVGREVGGDLAPTLIAELFRVDDGTTLWRGEFEVGPDLDRRTLLIRVATQVTELLDLPRSEVGPAGER